jgi:hypothetical protein
LTTLVPEETTVESAKVASAVTEDRTVANECRRLAGVVEYDLVAYPANGTSVLIEDRIHRIFL